MTDNPTRAVLRTTFPAQQAANDLSAALTEWLGRAGPSALFRTCGSCTHMACAPGEPAHCTLYNMVPPVAVILAGCDSHKDEGEIPF